MIWNIRLINKFKIRIEIREEKLEAGVFIIPRFQEC